MPKTLRVYDPAMCCPTGVCGPNVDNALVEFAGAVKTLAAPGRGLIMTMGKGGVGKTTMAVAIAAELARQGHPVHLLTTDPPYTNLSRGRCLN